MDLLMTLLDSIVNRCIFGKGSFVAIALAYAFTGSHQCFTPLYVDIPCYGVTMSLIR